MSNSNLNSHMSIRSNLKFAYLTSDSDPISKNELEIYPFIKKKKKKN